MLFKADTILTENYTKLIAGCISGERSCQSALYKLLAPKMMIVCMRYTKNQQEAEEVLQDGFMRAFRFMGELKKEYSLEGWMKKIMVNCALQKLRTQMHLKVLMVSEPETETEDHSADIIAQLTGKEMLYLIQSLSPAYRVVFNLYFFEGMKHREIAELLHIEEGTSKSNLAQAKKILQRALIQNLKIAK